MTEWWVVAPGWIATIAIVIAGMQVWSEHRTRRADLDRNSRDQATRFAAWVVVGVGEKKTRAVKLQNLSGGFFHDITVEVKWMSSRVPTFTLALLPPGEYLVTLESVDGAWGWKEVQLYDEADALRPMVRTDSYQVVSMSFSDRLGRAWKLDGRGVLSVG